MSQNLKETNMQISRMTCAACSKEGSMDHGNMDHNSNKKQTDTNHDGMNHGDMTSTTEIKTFGNETDHL